MVAAVLGDCPSESTSASDPRLVFKFCQCEASVGAHTEPVSPTSSVDRHNPLSLPTYSSSGLPASHANPCWYSPTCALMHVVELVVFRHTQPPARLHFQRSLSPAKSSVSCPEGIAD